MSAFILVVVTHVYFGTTVTMQEFSSKTSCEAAIQSFKQNKVDDVNRLFCIPK
ncbi:hypothetical protein [Marinobacterium litorale]|uniref:hypothetical protein n=1 Tax=Marinobacterium litorale TaxID=404770 RepID=UPI0012EC7E60|nr:hypothetical protein [Marinobacterium litorale]